MNLQQSSAIAISLCASFAQASPLTWDANGTGAGQTNGGGAWLGANQWWSGATNQSWVAGSDAIFGGADTNGGAVTLASPTSAGSITFNAFTGTYTLGTLATPLTVNGGITNNSASGAVSLTTSPIVLGAPQTWTNQSSGTTLARSGVDNGGHTLTIDGTGGTSFDSTTAIITGTGGLTKNGSGRLVLGGGGSIPAHNYSGITTLNGGVTMVSNNNLGPGNLVLNGGIIESYWTSNFTRGLGPGNGQVRIAGGASGFSMNGANGMSVIFGNNATNEAQWGTEHFSPDALVLQAASAQAGASLTFANRIDLRGATRTVRSNATALAVSATISGAIRNSDTVNPAGLVKAGPGLLILSGANTYNGGTTISQGNLRFGVLTAMPATGEVLVQDGTTLTVEAGASGDWTAGTSGHGTIGGLLAGLGGQSGSTVAFDGNVTLGLEMTANLVYPGSIGNVGTSLALTKSGGSSLTLSGLSSYSGRTSVQAGTLSINSLGKVGGGDSALGNPASAASGRIDLGYRTTAATLAYTGSGHASDRVINLSGTTGGATLNASGTGPLTLTSGLTATTAGAKTLVLTGTNTEANSLAASANPNFAGVLTIQKTGTGTWWVLGFTSQQNAWSVTAGTLVANGTITTGDQQFTVSGGTLAGVGPIQLQSGKTLTVQAAGSLAPGNLGEGTLALTGNLNVAAMAAGTGKLNFQIGTPESSDRINVTGIAQIGTGVLGFNDFVFSDMGGIVPGTYVLVSASGGISGTLDPANRSGMIGSVNGTLRINGNNLEWSTDQDLDGIPDVYELANTIPSSATAFNPTDDLDADGSSNLQEYLAGTDPNLDDTDGDGFKDGVESGTGTWMGLSSTGTNPLVFDTDGDTLRDGDETNTGVFVSLADPGTNPNKADSDGDALRDTVETNTGTFVSKTDTGTNPNRSDTDNDGAGDWYEITASFTSPFLTSEKPGVPYPLPDPDNSAGLTDKPVKVYIMSGQSNMVGMGLVSGTSDATLETIAKRENKFPDLVNSSGGWTARQDVRYRGVISDTENALLSPGSLGTKFGPELGFGYVMGWFHDEPVLLLKSSIGNRALGWDILPPGGVTYQADGYQFPAYGETPEKWTIGSPVTPWVPGAWYAGKEFDRFFMDESQWAHPDTAATNVVDVLDGFAAQYPGWASQGFEIAGFVWWQGDRDRYTMGHATRYEQNLVRLIDTLRSYYENRYNTDQIAPGQPNNLTRTVPNAPFVLATLGQTVLNDNSHPAEMAILDAQLAVDGTAGNYPRYKGNVKTVYFHPLSEGGASNGHYNERAGTYMMAGDSLGRAMVDLLQNAGPGTPYGDWAAGPFAGSLGDSDPTLDFDKGGLQTGVEWVLGGDPTSGADDASITPVIDTTTDPDGKLLFIFRRDADAKNDSNTSIAVEYGNNLSGWTTATHQGTGPGQITVTEQANGFAAGIDRVTVALPPSLAGGGRIFARLKVGVTAP